MCISTNLLTVQGIKETLLHVARMFNKYNTLCYKTKYALRNNAARTRKLDI